MLYSLMGMPRNNLNRKESQMILTFAEDAELRARIDALKDSNDKLKEALAASLVLLRANGVKRLFRNDFDTIKKTLEGES